MKRTKIIFLLVAFLCVGSAAYSQNQYIIKKGETLWDVAKAMLIENGNARPTNGEIWDAGDAIAKVNGCKDREECRMKFFSDKAIARGSVIRMPSNKKAPRKVEVNDSTADDPISSAISDFIFTRALASLGADEDKPDVNSKKSVTNVSAKSSISEKKENRVETAKPMAQSLYRVTTQRVNVRAAASTKSAIVGTLNMDDKILVTNVENGWASITFKEKNCYVNARYLEQIKEENDPVVKTTTEFEHTDSVVSQPTQQAAALEPEQPYNPPIKGRKEVLWNLKGGFMQKSYNKDANTKKNGTDWMAGIEVEVPLSDKLNIETGLRYKEAYRIYEEDWGNGYAKNYELGKTIRMLEIPLRLTYKYALNSNLMLHIGAGPYVSNDLFSNSTDTQVGIEPSAVLYWKNLNLGLHYDFPFYKSTNGSQKARCATNNVAMLTLGIRFKSKVWRYVGTGLLVAGTVAATYAAATHTPAEDSGGVDEVEGNIGGNSNKQAGNVCDRCNGTGKCTSKSVTSDKYWCHGKKTCQYCKGKGVLSQAGNSFICNSCNGTGKCRFCNGSGLCSKCKGSGKK